jgi:hypothetical protein
MCTLIRTAHEADAGGAFTKPQDVFSLSITVGRPQDYPKLRAAIRFVLGEGENTFEYTINY